MYEYQFFFVPSPCIMYLLLIVMRLISVFFVILLFFGAEQTLAKEPKAAKSTKASLYAVGVATSFNDSIAYCTEMQVLNDAELDRKKYLHRRSGYSFQLRDYLVEQGKMNYTCITLFNVKKAKLEKELAKVKNRFSKDNIKLIEIKESEFKFVKPDELNF